MSNQQKVRPIRISDDLYAKFKRIGGPSWLRQQIAQAAEPNATRVYLSGPMTGLPDFNYPAFNQTAGDLRAAGYHVENPAENEVRSTWAEYMKSAVAQLTACDKIKMLPGWEASRGARIEYQLAQDLGIEVME